MCCDDLHIPSLQISLVAVVAFALYLTPLLYMAEKAVGVHEKKFPLRMVVRLPVGKLSIASNFLQAQQPLSCWIHPWEARASFY